jgi:hypothetical protein
MRPADRFRAVEIGDGARDLQHAVIAARRKPHGVGGIAQQFHAGAIGSGDLLKEFSVCLCINAQARLAERAETRSLELARRGNACGHFTASFRRRRQNEIRRRNRRDFNMKIDAVEKRSRKTRLIIRGAAHIRTTLAGKTRIVGASAAAATEVVRAALDTFIPAELSRDTAAAERYERLRAARNDTEKSDGELWLAGRMGTKRGRARGLVMEPKEQNLNNVPVSA